MGDATFAQSVDNPVNEPFLVLVRHIQLLQTPLGCHAIAMLCFEALALA